MEEKEIWKDIEGFEGKYQVSNMGRVKSVERTVWNSGKGCYKTVPEKILKPRKNRDDYMQVALYKDGKGKWFYVHQLVGQAFLDNPSGFNEINHIDENKENNKAINLEYCSRSYNMNYGTGIKRRTEKNSKPLFSVDKESGLIMWWKSAKEAEECTGIAHQNICACLKGKTKSSGGFYWMYANTDDAE